MVWIEIRDWLFAPCYYVAGAAKRSIAKEFTRAYIQAQKRDANIVALARQVDVYVYDAAAYFVGARRERVGSISIVAKDGKLALLCPTIQLIMRDCNEYLQFNTNREDVCVDRLGVRVLARAALEMRVATFREELRTNYDQDRLKEAIKELKEIVTVFDTRRRLADAPAPTDCGGDYDEGVFNTVLELLKSKVKLLDQSEGSR